MQNSEDNEKIIKRIDQELKEERLALLLAEDPLAYDRLSRGGYLVDKEVDDSEFDPD